MELIKEKKYFENASCNWSDDSIRLIVTPAKATPSIFYTIQEVGSFRTRPPYFTERENLNSFLILYTVSGIGRLEYMGGEYTLRAGSCFFIRCTEHHLYRAVSDEWDFLWLHFNGSNSLGLYNQFTINGFKTVHIKDTFAFSSTLMRIIAINKKRDFGTEILSSNLVSDLLTDILIDSYIGNAPSVLMRPLIRNVMKFIDNRFTERLSLDEIAAQFSLSKFYLEREFRHECGTTVGEYIILKRISYAKELLSYSDMPIGDIAYEVGVPNVSHFIRLFKAREGLTPLAFRKNWSGALNPREQYIKE